MQVSSTVLGYPLFCFKGFMFKVLPCNLLTFQFKFVNSNFKKMNRMKKIVLSAFAVGILFSCGENADNAVKTETTTEAEESAEDFQWEIDRFKDLKILRYQAKDFDNLTLQQKKYVYYLTQAGYAGRDINYDQNYKHNLEIRYALENIVRNYEGEKGEDWNDF